MIDPELLEKLTNIEKRLDAIQQAQTCASDCSHGCEHSDVEQSGNPSRSHENRKTCAFCLAQGRLYVGLPEVPWITCGICEGTGFLKEPGC